MKIQTLPSHFNIQNGCLPNNVNHEVNHQVLTCIRTRFLLPKHRFPLNAANFGDHLKHGQVKSKQNLQKSLKISAKLQGNDDTEINNWQTYDYKPDAAHTPATNYDSETSHVKSSESHSHSDDTNFQSLPAEELCQNQLSYQSNLDKIRAVLLHVLASEQWNASRLKVCQRTYTASATNLIHYLALQLLDVRQLKEDLSSIGLLDLECAKSSVLVSITAAIQLLENSVSYSLDSKQNSQQMYMKDYGTSQENEKMEYSISAMRKMSSTHAAELLGPVQDKKSTHIMVTVGKEATVNEMLLHNLLKAGANIIRINCAHDDSSVWSEIIRLVKHSSQMLEKPCRILMDLAGPKLRTGPMKSGPNVMKISPQKDAKGDVVFASQVWLSSSSCGPPSHISPDAILFVEGDRFLNQLEVGSILRFVDVKGRKRKIKISKKFSVFSGHGYIGECSRNAYVESGTRLYLEKKKGKALVGRVVDVPAAEQFVRLRVGDLLTISRYPSFVMDKVKGNALGSPRITCDCGRLFDSVKSGEPIAFDDGKIWGVIQGASINEVVVQITHANLKGSKLGPEKSINIPKSDMQFEGLTSKDLMDLEFVATNADMVGISFIRDVHDMAVVLQELEKRKLRELGVVLKIETSGAFEKLPLLLLQAMQYPNPFGVMIARGDLAVECGWDQMASIQEEILSICSAAHIPVIWATQVLESLVKSGIPTRAEITDVACGMRANCIMLNKGKYIVEAVTTLGSILNDDSAKKKAKTSLKPLLFSSS